MLYVSYIFVDHNYMYIGNDYKDKNDALLYTVNCDIHIRRFMPWSTKALQFLFLTDFIPTVRLMF